MQGLPLLQRSAQSPMKAVLQVQIALVGHDVGEEIAVERGILLKEGFEIQGSLGGDQLVQPDLMRRDRDPLLLREAVVRVGAGVANSLEDHGATLQWGPSEAP